jgi:hypothetical protein
MDEEAFDLRDVSSDVEINPDEAELDSDSDDAQYARSANAKISILQINLRSPSVGSKKSTKSPPHP